MKYSNYAAAFKFEIVNNVNDIGEWEFMIEKEVEEEKKCNEIVKGSEMSNFLDLLVAFNPEEVQVIYVKNLTAFELIGENYFSYSKDFKASGTRTFYSLKIKGIDFVEFRNWDSFFENVNDTEEFLGKMSILRNCFRAGRKNKLELNNNLNYTLARHMWLDIVDNYYLYADWAKAFVKENLPKSEGELNLLLNCNKGGFYMINNDYIDKVVENVYSYDSSSCHISLMSRKPYPYGGFTEEKDTDKIMGIILGRRNSWIGQFTFSNLKKKVNLPIDLTDFGVEMNGKYVLVLTDVDFEWFVNVFEFDEIVPWEFYFSKKKTLPKNILTMCDSLYREKEEQKKGTFAKELAKFRAELPFGQSIKKPFYDIVTYYDEENNNFVVSKKSFDFEDVIDRLGKRNLPYQLGIWTVAYSRLELIKLIMRIGVDKVIYADTDSVKFIGEEGIEIMKCYNREINVEFSRVECKMYMKFTSKMGRWQFEGCYKFKSIGIKWYLTEENGELTVKAAGAQNNILLKYLEEQEDPFESFSKDIKIDGLFKNVEYNRRERYVTVIDSQWMNKEMQRQFERVTKGTIIFS